MDIDLEQMSYEELLELNRRIVERLRFLQQVKALDKMIEFRVGERVIFRTREGELVSGTLVRHNKKTVSIVTDDGYRWNVSPQLLKKENEGRIRFPDEKPIIDVDAE